MGKKAEKLSRRRKGLVLCDQKANSVADIAWVLGKLETVQGQEKVMRELKGREEEEGEQKVRKNNEDVQIKKVEEKKRGERIGLTGEQTGAEVTVEWKNLVDAEYAETWSGNVVHGVMQLTSGRMNRGEGKLARHGKIGGLEGEKISEPEKERLTV